MICSVKYSQKLCISEKADLSCYPLPPLFTICIVTWRCYPSILAIVEKASEGLQAASTEASGLSRGVPLPGRVFHSKWESRAMCLSIVVFRINRRLRGVNVTFLWLSDYSDTSFWKALLSFYHYSLWSLSHLKCSRISDMMKFSLSFLLHSHLFRGWLFGRLPSAAGGLRRKLGRHRFISQLRLTETHALAKIRGVANRRIGCRNVNGVIINIIQYVLSNVWLNGVSSIQ